MSSKAKDYITQEEEEALAVLAILAEEGYLRNPIYTTVRGSLYAGFVRCPLSAGAYALDPDVHAFDLMECTGPVVRTLGLPQRLASRIAEAADDPNHRLHKPLRFAVFGEKY